MTTVVMLVPHAPAKHVKSVQKIPFKLYRNHLIVVTGRLGPPENRNFLIDTGSNPTVVDEALAHELSLKPIGRPPEGMSVVGGVVQAYDAVLASFDLGPIHREHMPVAVANLSLMQAEVGLRIDAIIGLDAIIPNNFQVDYESRQLSFGDIRLPPSTLAMAPLTPFVVVQSEINGRAVNLMIDTGTSQLVLFRDALPDFLNSLPVEKEVQLSNVVGDVMTPQIRLSEFRVGNSNLSGSTAVLATIPRCCDFDGILGMSELLVSRVSFDFQGRQVSLELPHREEFIPALSCESLIANASCRQALLSGASHSRY